MKTFTLRPPLGGEISESFLTATIHVPRVQHSFVHSASLLKIVADQPQADSRRATRKTEEPIFSS
jgi:hypothetical protein